MFLRLSKYSIILISLLTSTLNIVSAQNIDSLKNLLSKTSEENRFEIYNQISNEYIHFSEEMALQYAYLSINSAVKSRNYNSVAKAYKSIGNIYYQNGLLDSAILYNIKSLEMYQILKDSSGIARTLNNLGIFNTAMFKYPEALRFHLNSLEIKKAIGDSIGIAYSCNNIGSVYYKLGIFTDALRYFEDAKTISEQLNDKIGINSSIANIGLIYFETKEYSKAIEYFKKSLTYYIGNNEINNISDNYINIADTYTELKDFESALDYLFKSININESYSLDNSYTFQKAGNIYAILGDTIKAIENYYICIDHSKRYGNIELAGEINLTLSYIFAQRKDWKNAYKTLLISKARNIESDLITPELVSITNKVIDSLDTDIADTNKSNTIIKDKTWLNISIPLYLAIIIITILLIIILFQFYLRNKKTK